MTNMIKIGEEMVKIFSGTRSYWDEIESRYWKLIWVDQVIIQLTQRNFRLYRNDFLKQKTGNRTIIEYAIQYSKNDNLLVDINYVR